MSDADEGTTQRVDGFDRRKVLEEARTRLSAISNTLSDFRIDAVELRKDAEELNAVSRRIMWLADVTAA
jgi:hypothetical protein